MVRPHVKLPGSDQAADQEEDQPSETVANLLEGSISGPQPSTGWPSDHLMIVADLALR